MNAPLADIGPTLDKRRAAELRARKMDKPITDAIRYAVEEWHKDAIEYLMKQTNERSAI